MADIDILSLGEPLIEMVRQPGPTDAPATYQSAVGGDALNALVAAARQGARTGLITAVGEDPFGEEILAFCRAEGIDTSAVAVRAQDPTGVCFIHPDPQARRFSYARRGSAASQCAAGDLPDAMIAAARVLHVTAVSQAISPTMRDTVYRAAEIARAYGTLVSYDLNLRLNLWSLDEARACIADFLPLADIVLPSDDEARILTGLVDTDQVLDHFAQHGAQVVVLKRGPQGVAVSQAGQPRTQIPAVSVEAIDISGAGDSFAGAFLAYLLETGDVDTAARRGVHVAAATVSGLGATGAMPHRHQILGASE